MLNDLSACWCTVQCKNKLTYFHAETTGEVMFNQMTDVVFSLFFQTCGNAHFTHFTGLASESKSAVIFRFSMWLWSTVVPPLMWWSCCNLRRLSASTSVTGQLMQTAFLKIGHGSIHYHAWFFSLL